MTYQIGQKFTYRPSPMIVMAGSQTWFGLRGNPQCEGKAKAWLKRHVDRSYSFFPVTKARKKMPRTSIGWVDYERRYLPGYLFARFPGEPIWNRLFDQCPFIFDVIRYTERPDTPAIIDPRSLDALHAMRSLDEENKAKAAARRTVRRGDKVNFNIAGKDYQVVEVMEIKGTLGKVKVNLLGRDEMWVDVGDMTKVVDGQSASENQKPE